MGEVGVEIIRSGAAVTLADEVVVLLKVTLDLVAWLQECVVPVSQRIR